LFEPKWGILEEQVKNTVYLQHHSDLATVLEEEWLKIPLVTVPVIPKMNLWCIGGKRRPYIILINDCGLKPGVIISMSNLYQ